MHLLFAPGVCRSLSRPPRHRNHRHGTPPLRSFTMAPSLLCQSSCPSGIAGRPRATPLLRLPLHSRPSVNGVIVAPRHTVHPPCSRTEQLSCQEEPIYGIATWRERGGTSAAAVGVEPLAALPNDGTPVSGGTRRRSSSVRTIKLMDPEGSMLNFSFAAMLISVRKRSKDLRRSISVDGAGRPDTASNASFETAQLIRRMPSRISKRIKFSSGRETALNVPLTSIPS